MKLKKKHYIYMSLIIFISEKELETLLNAAFFGTVDHDFDH